MLDKNLTEMCKAVCIAESASHPVRSHVLMIVILRWIFEARSEASRAVGRVAFAYTSTSTSTSASDEYESHDTSHETRRVKNHASFA